MFNNFLIKLILLLNLASGLVVDIHSQIADLTAVKIITLNDLNTIINDDGDRALLINIWATWCVPCREEFPELVSLARNYNKEVRVVGISVDEKEELDSKVIPFLKKQEANFQNYLLTVRDPEDFINSMSKDWSGAIPATFIYDKDRNQQQVLIGKQTYEEFKNAVNKVIN